MPDNNFVKTATCRCKNIDIGSYENQEVFNIGNKLIGIDRCIVAEVKALWGYCIKTIESCCGHNKDFGYIAVSPEYISLMKRLGYAKDERVKADNIFYSKTRKKVGNCWDCPHHVYSATETHCNYKVKLRKVPINAKYFPKWCPLGYKPYILV